MANTKLEQWKKKYGTQEKKQTKYDDESGKQNEGSASTTPKSALEQWKEKYSSKSSTSLSTESETKKNNKTGLVFATREEAEQALQTMSNNPTSHSIIFENMTEEDKRKQAEIYDLKRQRKELEDQKNTLWDGVANFLAGPFATEGMDRRTILGFLQLRFRT